jgi:hypothetical protein
MLVDQVRALHVSTNALQMTKPIKTTPLSNQPERRVRQI